MKKTLTLRGQEQIDQACRLVKYLDLDGPLHKITIEPVNDKRSLDANALYWKWATIIGGELGNTKDEQHEWNKVHFLVPIFDRDDPEYHAMIEAVKECRRKGLKNEADAMKKVIIRLTSTTKCTKAQMNEFMTAVSGHAGSLAIRLPAQEDC